jgi:prepilin-type N-terminal cleavage/methylation domain-containing protein
MRQKRGFTLIEMTVVLVVLVLFAALITPNVITMQSRQQRREADGQILNLARQGRESAIESGFTYAMMYDSAKTAFVLKKEPPPQDAGSVAGTLPTPAPRPLANVQSVSDLQQVQAFNLPSGVEASKFVANDDSVDGGSWIVHFYADGTSDGGGVEITQSQAIQAIQVTKDGFSSIIQGSLPESTEQIWTAGTYAQQD